MQKWKCKAHSVSHHLHLIHNPLQPMFMPYIEGPKMDWTVNDSLYLRFLKWKLKCENILDCELAMLPESKKYKKVITRSGDYLLGTRVSYGPTAQHMQDFPIFFIQLNYVYK